MTTNPKPHDLTALRIFAALDLNAAAHRRRLARDLTGPHDKHMRRRLLDNARFMLAEARYSRIKAQKLATAHRLEDVAAQWRAAGQPLIADLMQNAARIAFRDYYTTPHPAFA